MDKLIQNFCYRSEIDGLRAIAVGIVLLYHTGLGFPGGYIGVDVFFVISGFLITSLILTDLEAGAFSFYGFWERRARRILPALVLVATTTIVGGWFLLLPIQFADLGKSAAYLTLFIANIYFYLGTGYFAGASEEKPLLHTWSLAVEEQYYLIFPVVLVSLYRYPSFRNRSSLLATLSVGILGSLAVSIYAVERHPAAGFYLLPPRAWELLLGSVTALCPSNSVPRSRVWCEFFSWSGLGCIIIPCFLYTKETPFPGVASIPPCLGAALFIWSTRRGVDGYQNSAARLLAKPPFVIIGLISYSLYLWHWPLVAYSNYWALQPQSVLYRLAIVLVSIALAYLTWRFVESPFRRRIICSSRRAIFSFAGIGLAAILIPAVTIVAAHGVPSRWSASALAFAGAQEDKDFITQHKLRHVVEGDLSRIGVTKDANNPSLLVWGDSHAMAVAPAFDDFLRENGIVGRAATRFATAPIIGFYGVHDNNFNSENHYYNEAVLAYVERYQIRDVVLVARWSAYKSYERGPEYVRCISGDGSARIDEAVLSALVQTVRQIVIAGARPWVFLQVPDQPFDVPKGLAFSSRYDFDIGPFCRQVGSVTNDFGLDEGAITEIKKSGGWILDPRARFLTGSRQRYLVSMDGSAIYRDEHHLSKVGAKKIILPMLREAFTNCLISIDTAPHGLSTPSGR